MKQGRNDRDSTVVAIMAFAAGAFLVWALLSGHPPSKIKPTGDLPAWVQAIGSILAIVVAIVVPWRLAVQARADLRERDLRDRTERMEDRAARAQSYAFVMLPQVDQIRGQILAAQRRWMRNPFGEEDIIELLTIPDGITEMLLQMHEVSRAGNEIRSVIVAVNDLRREVSYFSDYYRNGGEYRDHENVLQEEMKEPDDVSKSFGQALAKVAKARIALTAILSSR
ncbi:hypothetical protein [Stenotrophomonas sp. PS02301]|uniref:hypothetical protein n=1 Tax=Stenotrophomonas sp. PS02301 TaxID=2991427 RepID=UPI00249B00B4|nr:hypothetical protein [Stenotrophomonas sp. PS02301]